MAPQTRRRAFPNVVIEKDEESEVSSSSSDEEEIDEEEAIIKMEEEIQEKKKVKAPITISLKKVCKVCPFILSLLKPFPLHTHTHYICL